VSTERFEFSQSGLSYFIYYSEIREGSIMAGNNPGVPAGGSLTGEPESPGTGEITTAGRNVDKPGIGSMGGDAPNFPGELGKGRTSTTITERTDADGPALDETDREYLDIQE
jgi:hypothetical protein